MDMRIKRADLHVHSRCSPDVANVHTLSPRALYERALANPDPQRRMDFFALTDHDTMCGYEELWRQLPEADRELLIPAVEHTLRDPLIGFSIHVNMYFLHPDQYARLKRQVEILDDLLAFCSEEGIFAQYNHPTWWEEKEYGRGEVDLAVVSRVADRFAVLELNGGRMNRLNLITAGMAQEKGKFLTATTDTHTGGVGEAFTSAPGQTARQFIANIWSGRGAPCMLSMTYRGLVRSAHGIIDEVLDQIASTGVNRRAMASGNPALESLAETLLNSHLVRRQGPAREAVRVLLKQLAKPAIWRWLGHQRRLERRVLASQLGQFLGYADLQA
jgi:predicted metal-dependent phosphoesterase TrpH